MSRGSGSQTLVSRFPLWLSKLNPLLRFGILFSLIFVPCDILSITTWAGPLVNALLSAYAHVSSWMLVVFGQDSHVTCSTITGPLTTISVFRGCDAIDPILVLCAGILAYPASWRNKLLGLMLGAPVLFAMNVVRILTLYIVRSKAPTWFEPMHLQIWPVVFVILAGILWFIWVRWTLTIERPRNVVA